MKIIRGMGLGAIRLGAFGMRLLGVARYEYRLSVRTAFFWIIAGVLLLFDLLLLAEENLSAFGVAWSLSHQMLPITVLLVIFFVAWGGHRLVREQVTEIALARQISSEELVLARFMGLLGAVLTLVAIQLLGGGVLRYLMAGPNEPIPETVAGWPRVQQHLSHFLRDSDLLAVPYRQAFWRCFPGLFFFSALAYWLALMGRTALVGALAGLYWFAVVAGRSFMPGVTDWNLSQNGPPYLFMGLFWLILALVLYERRRRRRGTPSGRWWSYLGILMLGAAGLNILRTALVTQDWLLLATDHRARYAQRKIEVGTRMPNYAWTDQGGHRVSLRGLRGQVLLLAFWRPEDRELETTLKRLEGWWRELRAEGLVVIGVGLSDDFYVARQLARAQNISFPLVVDLENVSVPRRLPPELQPGLDPDLGRPRGRGNRVAPVAAALEVGSQVAVLLDRDGYVREKKLSLAEDVAAQTHRTLEKYVRGEGKNEDG